MIRILGCLFWNIVRTRLAGPEKANRPILVLVEDAEEPTQENISKVVASSSHEVLVSHLIDLPESIERGYAVYKPVKDPK